MSEVTNATQFYVVENGQIMTIPQIMAAFPAVSIPVGIGKEGMFNAGYIMIFDTTPPEGDVVTPGAIIPREDGYYDQGWSVRDYTPEERTAKFEQDRSAALEKVASLRYAAIGEGAPLVMMGTPAVFSLVGTSRQDYRDYVARARTYIERGLTTTTRVYSKAGASFVLSPQRVIDFGMAVEDQYYGIFGQAEDLQALVSDATEETGLPQLPEAITVEPIAVV